MKQLLISVFIFFFLAQGTAGVICTDSVPAQLREQINEIAKNRRTALVFSIEADQKYIIIASEDGMMKRVPIEKVTADDLFNIMETMAEQIEIIRVTQKKKEEQLNQKPAVEETPEMLVVTPVEPVFKFADSDSRFYFAPVLTNEEVGAAGIEITKGIKFIRFGLIFKKGQDIELSDKVELKWFAAGVLAQMDLMRLYNFTASTGLQVFAYNTSSTLYELDYLFAQLAFKYRFLVPALRLNFAPTVVELKAGTERYYTDRLNVMFMLNFAL